MEGLSNLFCAGEKAGLLVGHTEAICTGALAGYNAVRNIRGETGLILPDSLAIGHAIREVRIQMREHGELAKKFTFSGSVLFEQMKARGLYTTDSKRVQDRVEQTGMAGVFSKHR